MALDDSEPRSLRELVQLARRLGVRSAEELSRSDLVAAISTLRRGSAHPEAADPDEPPESGGLFSRVLRFARSITGIPSAQERGHGYGSDEPSAGAEALVGEPDSEDTDEVGTAAVSGPDPSIAEEPIRTRTMARLLASQGHAHRALAIYRELVAARPHDAELTAELDACAAAALEVREVERPVERRRTPRGPDEVVSVQVDPTAVLVSWEVSEQGLARARRLVRGEADLTARLVIVARDELEIIRTEVRERRVARMGEWLVPHLPAGAVTTAAVGLRAGDAFVSVAHSPVLHEALADDATRALDER